MPTSVDTFLRQKPDSQDGLVARYMEDMALPKQKAFGDEGELGVNGKLPKIKKRVGGLGEAMKTQDEHLFLQFSKRRRGQQSVRNRQTQSMLPDQKLPKFSGLVHAAALMSRYQ